MKIYEIETNYETVQRDVKIGAESVKVNVSKAIPVESMEAFCIFVEGVVLDGGVYRPWMLKPAIDAAEVLFYTDIERDGMKMGDLYRIVTATDIVEVIENTVDLENLAALKIAARKYVEHRLDNIGIKGSIADLFSKMNDFADTLTNASNIDIGDVKKLVTMADKMNSVDEDKILDFVTKECLSFNKH